ncbi:hypothetical protein HNR53_001189 [Bacillus benzoevorans]|uniref:Uncharacterized protein n=1 Tax=Bacillus benzoevorans TaxID=1456 RepID=A0A7X0LUL8_9BACI|nr:hypothetical protein [Bacillus benzoevorans]
MVNYPFFLFTANSIQNWLTAGKEGFPKENGRMHSQVKHPVHKVVKNMTQLRRDEKCITDNMVVVIHANLVTLIL